MKQLIYLFCFLGFATTINAQTQNIVVPKTQQGVVTKLAATWCPFCGGQAWNTYKNMVNDLSTKSLVMVVHRSASSRLYSATAEKILTGYDPVFYQPFFFFNTKVVGEGDAATGTEMKKKVDNVSALANPTAHPGLQVRYNASNRELEVMAKTEFFKTVSGDFTTGIYLIEKSVIAAQANRTNAENHLNVLRTHFGTNEFGFEIGQGTMMNGFFKVTSTKLTLPSTMKPENTIVASIIWQKDGNVYSILNSNWIDVAGFLTTVGVQEDQELKAGFTILPNIITDKGLLEFNLPKSGQQVLVQAYNLQGQLVSTLYQGNLPAGKHQFPINRTQLTSKGLYFVRLLVDGQFATRKVIAE